MIRAQILSLILVGSSACLSQPGIGQTPEPPTQWKYLFNGINLDGWVNINGDDTTWTASDGMIRCTGKPICALRTLDKYENFILELEWRHLKSGGNAGVFLWAAAEPATGQPFLRAIEVQVLDHGYGKSDWFTTHGDVFPIHGSSMKPFPPSRGMRSFPSESRSLGAPEWNHYRIECLNGTLRLSVNGKEVSGGSDCTYRKGFIALESEGSPVDFKNIRIKKLPDSGDLTSDMTAPDPGGYIPLYNGVDMDGWITTKDSLKIFKPSDWRLAVHSSAEPQVIWSRYHASSDSPETIDFFFDIKVPESMDLTQSNAGGLVFFNADKPAVSFGPMDGVVQLNDQMVTPGKWTRIHGSIRKNIIQLDSGENSQILTIPVEATETEDKSTEPGEFLPVLGIQSPAGTENIVEYANIFVRQ